MEALTRSLTRLRLTSRHLPSFAAPLASSSHLPTTTWAAASYRFASNLSNLQPAPGSRHSRKRVGRGQGSGYGGTSGKGHKGQNARSGGGVRLGFAGGQTPIMRAFPKQGKVDPQADIMTLLPLSKLQTWIDQNRLDPTQPITTKELVDSGCVTKLKQGVELRFSLCDLGNRGFARHSGVQILHPRTLRALVYPHRFAAKQRFLPIDVHPRSRTEWLRYTDWEHRRGYLGNPEVAGELLEDVAARRRAMGWATRGDLAVGVGKAMEELYEVSGKGCVDDAGLRVGPEVKSVEATV